MSRLDTKIVAFIEKNFPDLDTMDFLAQMQTTMTKEWD
jgi:hypothetical protein